MSDSIKDKLSYFDENYKVVTEKIRNAAEKSNRAFNDITLLAATKTVEVPVINYSYEKGIKTIGENRVQEYLSKEGQLNKDLKRHFIGTLQTNKVRQIVGKVELIHSVDSVKLAKEIAKRSLQQNIVSNILVEINIANEQTKSGISESELPEFLSQLSEIKGIFVKGLMTLGPVGEENNKKIRYFDKMNKLFIDNRAKKVDNISIELLSMGMSDDFELAVMSGSNIVRLGSALFGKRL